MCATKFLIMVYLIWLYVIFVVFNIFLVPSLWLHFKRCEMTGFISRLVTVLFPLSSFVIWIPAVLIHVRNKMRKRI